MTVRERDFVLATDTAFNPFGQMESLPHQPTNGIPIKRQLLNVSHYVRAKVDDALVSGPGKSSEISNGRIQEFREDADAAKFLNTSEQLSNKVLLGFIGILQGKYKSASIKFLSDSLMSAFNSISKIDPFYAVTGTEEPSWLMITKENSESFDLSIDWENSLRNEEYQYKERYIVYPFVYPGNRFRFAHIVLIIIDQEVKKIYYYDSQGLTSDDPARQRIFSDNLYFNMHDNLKKLACVLFKGRESVNESDHEFIEVESELIENVERHQFDSVSCGIFVCRALERLYQGMTPPEALSYDPNTEVIMDTRKRMGLAYMRAMQEIEAKYSLTLPKKIFKAKK